MHEELSDGHVSVTVLLHERQIARASVECALVPEEGYTGHSWPEAAAVIALGEARAEAVGGIFAHFYGAQDMAAGTEDAEEVAAA